MYPESPKTFEEIERLAERVIDRQTRNFVNDAFILARWVLSEGKRLVEAEQAFERKTSPSLRPVFDAAEEAIAKLEETAHEMADAARR